MICPFLMIVMDYIPLRRAESESTKEPLRDRLSSTSPLICSAATTSTKDCLVLDRTSREVGHDFYECTIWYIPARERYPRQY